MSPLRELPIINLIAHVPEKVHQPGVYEMTEKKFEELKSEEELAAEEEAAVAEKEDAAEEEEENGAAEDDDDERPIDGTNADADAGVTAVPQEPTER